MIRIRIDDRQLRNLLKRLERSRARWPEAIREGLNQGGDKVRTEVRRVLQVQMGTKTYRAITSNTRTVRATANGSGLWSIGGGGYAYQIIGSPKPIKIEEFRIQSRGPKRLGDWRDQSRVSGRFGPIKAKGSVVAAPWAVSRAFKRSFDLVGKGLVAIRPASAGKGGRRLLYGPTVAKEMLQGETPRAFTRSAARHVPPIILARLGRSLGAR